MSTESEHLKELDLLVATATADAWEAADRLLVAREEIKRLTTLTKFHCYECGGSFEYETQAQLHGMMRDHAWRTLPKVKNEDD